MMTVNTRKYCSPESKHPLQFHRLFRLRSATLQAHPHWQGVNCLSRFFSQDL
jgi:hypothetical protein